MRRAVAALSVLALTIAGSVVVAPVAVAAPAPGITVAKAGPATVLAGEPASFTLTAANPSSNPAAVPEYNVSFRDVLPVGVSYVGGSTTPVDAGEPTVIADQPAAGLTTLIWSDNFDLQKGSSNQISFAVTADPSYPVGSTFSNTATGYASTKPRVVPKFTASGTPIPNLNVQSATSNTTTTTISAIEVTKSEPSPEAELLRGVHDHPTVYSVPVRNNSAATTTGVVVTDYLPANLEFLGCGGVDNSAAPEYPGSGSLTGTPVIAPPNPADAAPVGCPTPASVDTVANPAGYPAGVYTKVTWNIGTLATGETFTIKYAAGVPLKQNVLFGAGAPSAASGAQAANLDNNTGASTRQVGPAASATNYVHASGTYSGAVAPGTSTAVTADTSHSVHVNDLRILKSVSPTTFSTGGIATYTLTIDASEYVNGSAISITDVLPNGVCPLDDVANYVTGAPADCAPVGFAPSVAYQSVVQHSDGTFTTVFAPIASISANGSLTVTYKGRMRTIYTGGPEAGLPVVAGDSFTNTASQTSTTTPIPNTGEIGPRSVTDPTSATQSTPTESLIKEIAPRVVPMACAAATYGPSATPVPANLTFAKGDRVCFQITATFSSTAQTRNPVVADFLPDNMTYEPASFAVGPQDTVPNDQVLFDEATAVSDGTLTWILGAQQANGVYLLKNAVFQAQFSAIVTASAAGPAPDKSGNIVKMRVENTAGVARSLRAGVNFAIAPAPASVVKGVAAVNGVTNPGGGDNVQVKEGDVVTFHVDLPNASDPTTNPPATTMSDQQVWDVLPLGITCAATSAMSNAGTCYNPGAAGQPTYAQRATQSAVVWTQPVSIPPGGSHSYTYDVTIPPGTGVATNLVNTASLRSYTTTTDLGGGDTAIHFPADNVDTTVDPALTDPNPASDPSNVFLAPVGLTKGVVSSINEAGNVGNEPAPAASTQATIGETVTFTVTARVPAGTTVFGGRLADPLPAGLTFGSASGSWAPDASTPVFGALPGGFTLDPATGTLTFPASYDNPPTTDQLFRVVITAIVDKADSTNNVNGRARVNTATFTSTAGPSGGPAPSPVTASATVTIVEPSPTLVKTNDHPAASTTVAGGTVVTYTLRAGNAAGRPVLHDSWVVDCLPAGVIFLALGTPPAGTFASQTTGDGPGGDKVSCPVGVQEVDWNSGDIAPGQTKTLTYTATVDSVVAGSVIYTNTASITGNSLAGARSAPTVPGAAAGRTYSATGTSAIKTAAATVVKTASPLRPTVGDTVTYTVTAQLPANINFYNAALIDTLPAGIDPASAALVSVTCTFADTTACSPNNATPLATSGTKIGWLFGDAPAATQIRTVVLVYTAKVADVPAATAGATLTNGVHAAWDIAPKTPPTAAGASFDKTGSNATAPIVVREPSMSIAKSVTKAKPEPGDTFTYTLLASNALGLNVSAAYNVTVTDTVPTGVVVNPATISNGATITGADPTTGGGTITWTFAGPVNPGATINSPAGLTYSATLAPSSTLTAAAVTNTARVTGYDSLPAGGRHYTGPSATAVVTPNFPQVSASKATPNGTTAYIGEPFAWKLTVSNAGGRGVAYHVGAVDTLPANWTYDTGSAVVSVNGATPTQIDPNVTTSGAQVQTLTWPDLATLPAGTNLTITYTATPTPGVTGSPGVGLAVNHVNSVTPNAKDATGASANRTGPYAGGPATATAHIASADVALTKAVGSAPVAGGTGTWTVTVTNHGPDPAAGPFTVTDSFDNPAPAGVTNVTAGGTGWSCTATPITCQRSNPADSLASGASFPPITVTYGVDSDVAAGTPFSNVATVGARTHDPNPFNNTDTATTAVATIADLGLVKTLTSDLVAGRDATYTVDVTNYGPSVARGPVTITDTLPAGTTFVSASGTGWICPAPVGGTLTCTQPGDLPVGAVAPQLVVTVHVPDNRTTAVTNTATVHGQTPEPSPDPHSNTDSATGVPATSADMEISKVLQGAVVAGGHATYRLEVVNHGPSAAQNVTVTDPLPALYTYNSSVGSDWSCAAAGQNVTCSYTAGAFRAGASSVITLVVNVGQQVNGTVTNTATVHSTTPDPEPTNNSSTSVSGVNSRADLSIAKSHTGTAVAGSPLHYTLAVHNHGPSDEIGDITVTDVLPVGLTYVSATGIGWICSFALTPDRLITCTGATDLANGADAPPIDVSVVVDHDAGPGTLTNVAVVTGNDASPDPNPDNNSDSDDVAVTVLADVTLTKTLDTPTPVVAGTQVNFTLQATNAGPSDARAVVVTDTLPDHLTAVSASGTGWTCAIAGQEIVCARPVIGANPPIADVAPITVVALVDPNTPIDPPDGTTVLTNTASVDMATPGTVHQPDPVPVPVIAQADLQLTKSAVDPIVAAGNTTTWQLAVTNLGPSAAAGPLTVVDTLPGFETFVDATGGGWTCTADAAPSPPGAGAHQTVTCSNPTGLAVGGSASDLLLTVLVDPTAPAGDQTNTATVSGLTPDPDSSNNTDEATISIARDVRLVIAKTHTGNGHVGQPLSFQIAVGNDGQSTADQVVVTDTLPAGLTYVGATGSGWTCSASGQDVTCTLAGTLDPHAAAPPITLVTTVGAEAYPGVANTAVASSTDPDLPCSVTGCPSSTDPVVIDPLAQLAVVKRHVGSFAVGQNGSYDITVTNTGPTPTPGPVSLTDDLPAGLSYVSASGVDWTCAAAWSHVACTFANGLIVQQSTVLRLVVAISAAAYPQVENAATATAPGSTPVTGTDIAPVTPDVVLSAVKKLQSLVNAVATYTITVLNSGTNATVTTTVVTDVLPSGLTYVSASGPGWVCTDSGQTVTCRHDAPIAPGATSTVTIVTTVTAAAGSTVHNVATVGGGTEGAVTTPSNGVDFAVASRPPLSATGVAVLWLLEIATVLLVVGATFLIVARRFRRI